MTRRKLAYWKSCALKVRGGTTCNAKRCARSSHRRRKLASPEELACRVAELREQPNEIERVLEEAARMETVRRLRENIPMAIIERHILVRFAKAESSSACRPRRRQMARIASRQDLPDAADFRI